MPCALDVTRLAVGQTRRDFFRQPNRKRPVLLSVPQPNGHPHFLERKTPRLSINLRVGNNALSRSAPGAALTFKTASNAAESRRLSASHACSINIFKTSGRRRTGGRNDRTGRAN